MGKTFSMIYDPVGLNSIVSVQAENKAGKDEAIVTIILLGDVICFFSRIKKYINYKQK